MLIREAGSGLRVTSPGFQEMRLLSLLFAFSTGKTGTLGCPSLLHRPYNAQDDQGVVGEPRIQWVLGRAHGMDSVK